MNIIPLCLLLLAPIVARAGEPAKPKEAPQAAAEPEARGAQANARHRRDKHAAHREKMTVLHEQMRAAKTPAERTAVQNNMRELRAARKAEMRRSGGADESAGKRRRGQGKGSGKGGGRGDGGGGGDGGGQKNDAAPVKTDDAAKGKPAAREKTGKP